MNFSIGYLTAAMSNYCEEFFAEYQIKVFVHDVDLISFEKETGRTIVECSGKIQRHNDLEFRGEGETEEDCARDGEQKRELLRGLDYRSIYPPAYELESMGQFSRPGARGYCQAIIFKKKFEYGGLGVLPAKIIERAHKLLEEMNSIGLFFSSSVDDFLPKPDDLLPVHLREEQEKWLEKFEPLTDKE